MSQRNILNLTPLVGKKKTCFNSKKAGDGSYVLVSQQDGCSVYVNTSSTQNYLVYPTTDNIAQPATTAPQPVGVFPDHELTHTPAMQNPNANQRKPLQINLMNRSNEVPHIEKKVDPGYTPNVFNRLEPRQGANLLTDTLKVNTDVASSQSHCTDLYSPSTMCVEAEDDEFDLDSQGHKRQSAFDRLGPVSEAKKPKLTINLNLNKEQRRVVQERAYVPFPERAGVRASRSALVRRHLAAWPWTRPPAVKKSFTARVSKSVMLMEKEQVEEIYGRDNSLVEVSVKGYPETWTKEDILDTLLDNLKGKSFIPCFIEMTRQECKFLVHKCKMALLEIHAIGFLIRQQDVELVITISILFLTVTQLDFRPKEVLEYILNSNYEDNALDMKSFTLQEEESHFIFYPLSRIYNQRELLTAGVVDWRHLTRLDLARNRLTSLDGFNLPSNTPRLKSLDLSHNHIPSLPALLSCRGLPIKSLWLEGNPLCLDVNVNTYVDCVRMMFSSLRELDGETLRVRGEMPKFIKNYCPEDAFPVVEKYLETFFTLLESDGKNLIENMYEQNAVVTVTAKNKLRHDSFALSHLRPMFHKCRVLEQKVYDCVRGAAGVRAAVERWPAVVHDPTTFTADVMHHTMDTILLKVTGVLKVEGASLAEDEHLLAFSRTVLLRTRDTREYKISNEMVYWDEPTREYGDAAFKLLRIRNKMFDLKFDCTPEKNVQDKLKQAFMKITQLEADPSQRCLEEKDWHFKNALEYYAKLVKLDNLSSLYT